MSEKNLIRQVEVEETIYDLGGSIYDLDEVSSSTIVDGDETVEVECLIFYCGSSTELND
jgi:hypothetical protein